MDYLAGKSTNRASPMHAQYVPNSTGDMAPVSGKQIRVAKLGRVTQILCEEGDGIRIWRYPTYV